MVSMLEDKEYLQFYWDLASEDHQVRLAAGQKLIQYLHEHILSKNDSKLTTEYKDYTLKRLIRGLASPRDFARQGFATALCEALNTFTYTMEEVLKLLDESTQTTASSKGSEDRDNMFGKLFGYAAILRSKMISASTSKTLKDQLLVLVDRIVELHSKKAWIQESTVEILFILFQQVQANHSNSALDNEFKETLLNKYISLTNTSSFEENNENQLSMLLGLQHMLSGDKKMKKVFQTITAPLNIPEITPAHMEEFSDALMHSTNKFPKIHKVWDYFMAFIVPQNDAREFAERPSALTATQQEALQTFVQFLDDHMWRSSKEKRSTAMKLSLRLASIVPCDCIPAVISESMIRSLALARMKTKNLLYDFAGGILKDLVLMTQGDHERTLSLLVALSQHGGMNFDKRTNTNTVQALVQGMDGASMRQYVQLLCGIIAAYDSSSSAASSGDVVKAMDVDGEDEDEEEKTNPAVNAISALITLARLQLIADKEQIQLAVLSVLSRLACFTVGETKEVPQSAATKADKKGKKKADKKVEAATTSVDAFAVECIRLLESGSLKEVVPEEIAQIASSQLMALVSDIALKSGHTAHSDGGNKEEKSAEVTSAADHAVTQQLWKVLHHMVVTSALACRHHKAGGDDEDGDGDDNDNNCMTTNISLPHFMEMVNGQITEMLAVWQEAKVDESLRRVIRFVESSVVLLILSTVQVLTSKDLEKEVCLQAAIVLKELLNKAKNNSFGQASEEDDEEDDEDDSLELRFFEACVDLLSLGNDQVIKGLRESIKRVWNSLIPLIGDEHLSQSFIDALVGQVSDPDDFDSEGAAEGQQEDEEEGDGSDQEEDSEAEELPKAVAGKKRKAPEVHQAEKQQKKAAKAEKIANKKKQIEAEEEIMLPEADMMDFLMVDDEEMNAELGLHAAGDNNDSDEEEGLMHTEEADQALINMIKARKETRKEGLIAAKRKQILLRSRLLDILEILVQRIRSGTVLFSLFTPLILGVKKLVTSKLLEDIVEAKTFTQRLQNLVQQQLCKKKFSLKIAHDEDLMEECNDELDILITMTSKLLRSKLLPLRQLAQDASLALARAIISSDCESAQEKILLQFTSITEGFIHLRRSQIPSKWLEDILSNRFPQFFLPTIWSILIAGLKSCTIVFVRNELNDMVMSILKKWTSLSAEVQVVLFTNMKALVDVVTEQLIAAAKPEAEEKDSKQGKGKDQSAKKVRPVVACAKTIMDTANKAKKDNNTNADLIKSKAFLSAVDKMKVALDAAKTFLVSANASNASMNSSIDQTLQAIASFQSSTIVSSSSSEKKKKKGEKKDEAKAETVAATPSAKSEEKKSKKEKDGKKNVSEEKVVAVEAGDKKAKKQKTK